MKRKQNGGKPVFCFSKNAPDVVQGKKSDETISVETTFTALCSNPEKSLGAEPVESSTIEKLTEAKRNLPEQKTPELQKKVNAAQKGRQFRQKNRTKSITAS